MDATIRNLDEGAYRELKARAALTGRTIGDVLSEAIRCYLARPTTGGPRGSLRDLIPELYPEGTEQLSEEIDAVVYGHIPVWRASRGPRVGVPSDAPVPP